MNRPSGAELLDAGGIKYLTAELLKRAPVVHAQRARKREALTGLEIKDLASMEAAARKLAEMGARAVIVKGGHMDRAVDVGVRRQRNGAAGRRYGENREHAWHRLHFCFGVDRATGRGTRIDRSRDAGKSYVTKAIEKGYPIGKGRMPLDHFYRLKIEPLARGTHELPTHGMHPAESGR